jgi:branched-chain amino acid transport system substrate-binding protein
MGVKTAAVIHHTDLHGIEFAGHVVPMLAVSGIDVSLYKSYPLGAKDLSPLLKKIKALDVDAFIAFSYPPGTFLITEQSKAIGLNPKLFYATVGVAYPAYRDKFGADTVEGVMGAGVWNPNIPVKGAREWYDAYVKRWQVEPDRWGTAGGYATGQIMQKAIEIAGTLDGEKVRDVIASETFDTVLGPLKFENQFNTFYPGHVGQWQSGEFEVVDKATRTNEPIYPKPAW